MLIQIPALTAAEEEYGRSDAAESQIRQKSSDS